MCDPLTIGSIAASAGGAYMNSREEAANARRAAQARQEASAAEFARQQGFQAQGQEAFSGALDTFQPGAQGEALNRAQTGRTAALQGAVKDQGEYAPAPASTPGANSEIARAVGKASRGARADAGRKARLGGWQDVNQKNATTLGRTGDRLGGIRNAASGSFGLLPFEQEVGARNARKPSSGIGDLLQLGGKAGMLAGFTGAFDPSPVPLWKQNPMDFWAPGGI